MPWSQVVMFNVFKLAVFSVKVFNCLVLWPLPHLNFLDFCIVAILKKWAAQYAFIELPQPPQQNNLYL